MSKNVYEHEYAPIDFNMNGMQVGFSHDRWYKFDTSDAKCVFEGILPLFETASLETIVWALNRLDIFVHGINAVYMPEYGYYLPIKHGYIDGKHIVHLDGLNW